MTRGAGAVAPLLWVLVTVGCEDTLAEGQEGQASGPQECIEFCMAKENSQQNSLDPTVRYYEEWCYGTRPADEESQAACFCGLAAGYECLLRWGCYDEAGVEMGSKDTHIYDCQAHSEGADAIECDLPNSCESHR